MDKPDSLELVAGIGGHLSKVVDELRRARMENAKLKRWVRAAVLGSPDHQLVLSAEALRLAQLDKRTPILWTGNTITLE